ncbi:MAG: hypothetical protein EOO90_22745 [Pedobacter sp.]|nr:MAG: hypothetical protein EOO90_22745 [Pedobacter sp.]
MNSNKIKKSGICVCLLILPLSIAFGQSYDNLDKIKNHSNYFHSKNAAVAADQIVEKIASAEHYFTEKFKVKPTYTLLILNPEDWKTLAHPKAIYGIPHYLPDGRLVVAAENNDFWRRNTPPIDQLPPDVREQFRKIYVDKNGDISLQPFFDLLAIHELGHAFQKSAEINSQRKWMNELMCNILLHNFVAEKSSENISALTLLPNLFVNNVDASKFRHTKLDDFETQYNEIAQNFPENYGWYQFRFHSFAGKIYDTGGEATMLKIWSEFGNQKQKLDDAAFTLFLEKADKNLADAIKNWDKN